MDFLDLHVSKLQCDVVKILIIDTNYRLQCCRKLGRIFWRPNLGIFESQFNSHPGERTWALRP